MRTSSITILTAAFLLILTFQARSQVFDDPLRFSGPADLVSARTAAMGNAFVGLADDVTALYWNPAGLAQLRYSEFSAGLTNFQVKTDATLLGSTGSDKQSVLKFNDIGLAIPVPVVRGALVFGAAYNRLADYSGGMNTSAYNHLSSIQRSLYHENADFDLAWWVGLEDRIVDSLRDAGQPGWLAIPVANNVQQTIALREEGSLGQWSFGGSTEIARGVMLGMSFNILTGYYRSDRIFVEEDVQNVHTGTIVGIGNRPRTDFQDVEINEIVNQDIRHAWNFTFGLLYNHQDKFRGGFTVRTPRYIDIREDYTREGTSFFRNSNMYDDYTWNNLRYQIKTPWVFSFGAAVNPVEFVVLSADVDITDNTEARFESSNDVYFPYTELNNDILRYLSSTNNFRLGTEINIPGTGLYLRGGFGYLFSPYREDQNTSDYDRTTWSGGVGYLFENNFMLNATIVTSSYNTWTYNYTDPDLDVPEYAFRTDQDISSTRLMFSLSHRF